MIVPRTFHMKAMKTKEVEADDPDGKYPCLTPSEDVMRMARSCALGPRLTRVLKFPRVTAMKPSLPDDFPALLLQFLRTKEEQNLGSTSRPYLYMPEFLKTWL